MPKGFTAKDERQVLAIKKSCRTRGGSKADCDRIAFATVNRRRRKEGRTLGDSNALTQRQMLLLDGIDLRNLSESQLNTIMASSAATYFLSPLAGVLLVPEATPDKLNIWTRGFFENVLPVGSVLTFTAAGLRNPRRGAKIAGVAAIPTLVVLSFLNNLQSGAKLAVVENLERQRRNRIRRRVA